MVESVFTAHGLAPSQVLDVTSVEAVKEAVRAGMGIGFVSELAMHDGDSGLLVLPLAHTALFQRQFSILMPSHGLALPASVAFLSLAGASG